MGIGAQPISTGNGEGEGGGGIGAKAWIAVLVTVALVVTLVFGLIVPMMEHGVATSSIGAASNYLTNRGYIVLAAGSELSDNLIPSDADTYNIGSTTKEWKSLYLGDAGRLYFGLGQEISLWLEASKDGLNDWLSIGLDGLEFGTTIAGGAGYYNRQVLKWGDDTFLALVREDDTYNAGLEVSEIRMENADGVDYGVISTKDDDLKDIQFAAHSAGVGYTDVLWIRGGSNATAAEPYIEAMKQFRGTSLVLSSTESIFSNVDNNQLTIIGGTTGNTGGRIDYYGGSSANPGAIQIRTPNATQSGTVTRLDISGVTATAIATWSSITHTGLTLSGELLVNGQNVRSANYLELDEITTPGATADHTKIYAKSDNTLYYQDGAGVEHGLTANTDTDVSGNSWVLDEDNMASDSALKLATQQSIKTYVDDSVGGATGGGPVVMVAASDAIALEKAYATATGGGICDGTNDYVEINAATTTGLVTILSSGTFHLGADMTLPANSSLIGQGEELTIFELDTADFTNVFDIGGDNATCANFTVDGEDTSDYHIIFEVGAYDNFRLHDVTIRDDGSGAYENTGVSFTAASSGHKIWNFTAININAYVIYTAGNEVSFFEIRNFHFEGCGKNESFPAIYIGDNSAAHDFSIHDGVIKDNEYAPIAMYGTYAHPIYHFSIYNIEDYNHEFGPTIRFKHCNQGTIDNIYSEQGAEALLEIEGDSWGITASNLVCYEGGLRTYEPNIFGVIMFVSTGGYEPHDIVVSNVIGINFGRPDYSREEAGIMFVAGDYKNITITNAIFRETREDAARSFRNGIYFWNVDSATNMNFSHITFDGMIEAALNGWSTTNINDMTISFCSCIDIDDDSNYAFTLVDGDDCRFIGNNFRGCQGAINANNANVNRPVFSLNDAYGCDNDYSWGTATGELAHDNVSSAGAWYAESP